MEYFLRTNSLLGYLHENGFFPPKGEHYEMNKIIERFLITFYNGIAFNEVYKKAISEIKEKYPDNKLVETASKHKSNIENLMKECNNKNKLTFSPNKNFTYINIKLGTFIHSQPFTKRLKKIYDTFKNDRESLMESIIFYRSLYGNNQQIGLSPKIYNEIFSLGEFVSEGFASPFNSFAIDFIMDNINKKEPISSAYHSIYEKDKNIGSSGSFFEVDNKDLKKGIWVLNPPYIEPILDKMWDKIKKVGIDNMRVFFLLPFFEDNKVIKEILSKTKHLTLFKDKHMVAATFTRKPFIATSNNFIATNIKEIDLKAMEELVLVKEKAKSSKVK